MVATQAVFLISDATGETAEHMVSAALKQFRDRPVIVRRFSNVRNKNQVYEALDQALASGGLIVYTMVNADLARLVYTECDALGLPCIDLLSPLLMRLSEYLGHSPEEMPGLLRGMNEEYFRRIEAVEFTVKHDDGQECRNLHKADIVLAGVSRTSKTPVSIYLAHRGWKVANVPIVHGINPPQELLDVDPAQVCGLIIEPQRLMELRAARLLNLRQNTRTDYADYEQIEEEIRSAKRLFRRQRWAIVDVSTRAVEETANEILKKLKLL
ncbi:MAG: phosphoenolpyruvate synthase regulatory protein [Desulfuromonas sp.]|jgi:regulator of PEP synthase PpsR (kinase-PPPase family)|nr:MAG: phosphoenolpyruvate synthase regulatory protein [Desulfuromonas sp.]